MLRENSVIIPFILPLLGVVTTIFFPRVRSVTVLFLLCSLFYSGWLCLATYSGSIFVTHVGSWPAPYGIVLIVDSFSALMLFFCNLVFLFSTVYGFGEKSHLFRIPLIFALQAGVSLSFITADFFNLFVSFEILLAASYALLLIEAPKDQKKETFPYVIINVVGSFLFLIVAAMAYATAGHLNMAALHLSFAQNSEEPLLFALGVAALIIYGLKAGLFPFYFWLPDTYPLLPYSLGGLFGGILTKVGVYVLVRLFVTVLPHSMDYLHLALLVLAGLTMFLGVLGAMSQKTIKKILSYHILSQVGYMALGLGLFTVNALAAVMLFVIHNIIVKSSLFWIGGEAARMGGGDELDKIKPLWAAAPFLGVCFLLQSLSLAGIPPLSGFWGKYLLFSSTLENEYYLLLLVALITSFWTLFSMVKIWSGAFWGKEQMVEAKSYKKWSILAIVLSTTVSLALGLGIEEVYKFSLHASNELFNPTLYVQAVLGGKE